MKLIETDVVIIGAGPVGLFQVFELGLHGLKAVVIDSLDEIGGQCNELYPDKPIYDIPALPNAKAKGVIDNLWQQAVTFDPKLLMSERVEKIDKISDTSFVVRTNKKNTVRCKSVIIAAGNGAFTPVKLKVNEINKFENKQLFYQVNNLKQFEGKNIVVLGGGDAALDWALALQKIAESVLLIHRSLNFKAAANTVDEMFTLCQQLKMQFLCGQVTGFSQEDSELKSLKVSSKDGITRVVELDQLVIFFGMSPKLGPISKWGLKMYQHQIKVDTKEFQTSETGIYAVGDVNYYPGKRKLILSGFHEAALAAFSIAEKLNGLNRVSTLYTTTSPIIHQRMGLKMSISSLMD